MWQVNGKQSEGSWIDLACPATVLYEFDGPKIFTCKDVAGSLFLAYQCGEDDTTMRFLVVPFSADLEERLTAGEMNLRDALMQSSAWILDVNFEWKTTGLWQVEVASLPPKTIPKTGVMLWPHLRSRTTTTAVSTETPPATRLPSQAGEPLNKPG